MSGRDEDFKLINELNEFQSQIIAKRISGELPDILAERVIQHCDAVHHLLLDWHSNPESTCLSVPVDYLFSTRVLRLCRLHKIKTLGDLTSFTESEVKKWRYFGAGSLEEINGVLRRYCLSFKPE